MDLREDDDTPNENIENVMEDVPLETGKEVVGAVGDTKGGDRDRDRARAREPEVKLVDDGVKLAVADTKGEDRAREPAVKLADDGVTQALPASDTDDDLFSDMESSGSEYVVSKSDKIMENGDDDDDREGDHDQLLDGGLKKRKKKKCAICSKEVINLPRHCRLIHKAGVVKTKKLQQLTRTQRVCPECGIITTRLDQHLMSKHKMTRLSDQFRDAFDSASVIGKFKIDDLQKCMNSYKNSLMSRSGGCNRSAATAQAHVSGIRVFLKDLSYEAILGLGNIGEHDGIIDTMLQEKRYQADSIKIYLGYVAKFLAFLSANQNWLEKVSITTASIETIASKIKLIAQSLEKDIHKEAVERQMKGRDEVEVKDFMVGGYLSSNRVDATANMIIEGETRKLRRNELLEARDCLCVQLLLSNAKRSGDVAHIRRNTVLDLDVPENPDDKAEIQVYEHKEAKSGKRCALLVSPFLLEQLQAYGRMTCDSGPYLFASAAKKAIVPSTMSKLVQRGWKRYGEEIGEDLPKLTASGSREVAVSTLRETGGDREQQMLLARHMAHNITTADRYYDKSNLREGRNSVVEKINQAYQDAAAARKLTPDVRGRNDDVNVDPIDQLPSGSAGPVNRRQRDMAMRALRNNQREMRLQRGHDSSSSSS